MLIEFHVIQDHGPSNMNRDRDGNPKTAFYGGVQRLRVSSQCVKRTLRQPRPANRRDSEPGIFERTVGSSHFGVRTRLLPEEVAKKWCEQHGPDAPFVEGIKAAVSIVAKKDVEQADTQADGLVRTPQAIYVDLDREIDRILNVLNELHDAGELESLADESQVFGDHLKVAAINVDWQGKDPSKTISWDKLRKEDVWAKISQSLDALEMADRPEGIDSALAPDLLIPSYELAEGVLRLIQNLEREQQSGAAELLKALAPEKGKKPKGGKRVSLADKLELTAKLPLSAADIALFGRMTTSDAFRDIEAACQVGDAVSTHGIVLEDDFFTAKDDLDTGTGAAHVGEAKYASAVFYKYLSVDYDALLRNLGGTVPKGKEKDETLREIAAEAPEIAAKSIEGLLRALMVNVPSGKINSHAHNQQPSLILVEIKPEKLATSYLTAFHDPARDGEHPDGTVETLLTDSVGKLLKFARFRARKMPANGVKRFIFATDEPSETTINRLRENLPDDSFFAAPHLTACDTFEDFVGAVNAEVQQGAPA